MNPGVVDARTRTITGVLELNERRCGTIEEATTELHRLMEAVRKTGKKGSISITLEIAPDKNDELALTMAQVVKTSIPKGEARKALIYHDPENLAFTKTDPRQLELLAEQEQERRERSEERERTLNDANVAQIGRGVPEAAAV